MPKIIDHDQRRAEIASAVMRIVARDGVKGVTMRAVAAEAGWSTGVLNHYFGGKQELLLAGLRLAARETGQTMARIMQTRRGDDRLRALIEEGMPLDARREALCRIFFLFWAEGVRDPDVWAELTRNYDWWRDLVRQAIAEGQHDGWIGDATDPALLAERALALADGLAMQAVFSTRAMPAERQRAHVAAWVGSLARLPAGNRT